MLPLLRLPFLRRHSTFEFIPLLWLSQRGRDPFSQSGVRDFLDDFEKLLSRQKEQVELQKLHPSLRSNIELMRLLQTGESRTIFAHITEHLSQKNQGLLSSKLMERYIGNLLAEENLNAAVSLIHILLNADSTSYCISNQTWSALASKACELGHYSAACLVYHEVIDPIAAYEDPNFKGTNNPLIPFLLFPDILAQLSIVLMHNGNNVAVCGIQSYFKRYYSYFWHRTIYRSIAIAKVEAHACAGETSLAIAEFVKLAWQHRGYSPLQKGSAVEHNLKYAVEHNLKERQKRILESDDPANDPSIVYNKFSLPGKRFNAIFDGVIELADTPYLNALILRNMSLIMADRSSTIERLVNFITSNHHALLTPVIASLCNNGDLFEAWAVLRRTKASYPRLHAKVLFRGGEVFTILFRAMRNKFSTSNCSSSEVRQIIDILSSCRTTCRETMDRGWTYECRVACLQALLACPTTLRQEVRLFLFEWAADSKAYEKMPFQFSLHQSDYNKLVELNVGDSLLSRASPTMHISL